MSLSTPEKIAQVAEHFAAHGTHGYSQTHRGDGAAESVALSDGTRVTVSSSDVDCSEMVRQCVNAAITGGYRSPIEWMYTGNEDELLRTNGFRRMAYDYSVVRRGDILLRSGHTGVAVGSYRQAEACHDENWGITGPSRGDQTGTEVAVNPLSTKWTWIYRWNREDEEMTEAEWTRMTKLIDARLDAKLAGVPAKVWGYKNTKLETVDAYQVLHDIPKRVWGFRNRDLEARDAYQILRDVRTALGIEDGQTFTEKCAAFKDGAVAKILGLLGEK